MGCAASRIGVSVADDVSSWENETQPTEKRKRATQPEERMRHERFAVCVERHAADVSTFEQVPKQEDEMKLIVNGFKQCHGTAVFRHLEEQQLRLMGGVMLRRSVPKDTIIIRQGDKANAFYVIADGEVDVFLGGSHKRVMTKGWGFGELGMLYNFPRSATCMSRTACELFVLTRPPFRAFVIAQTQQRLKAYEEFLRHVPLFQTVGDKTLSRVADCLERRSYAPGEVIMKQGDPGDFFCIIESGTVAITDENDASGKELLRGPSDYFGETALLKDVGRTATCTAVKTAPKAKAAPAGENGDEAGGEQGEEDGGKGEEGGEGVGVVCLVMTKSKFQRVIPEEKYGEFMRPAELSTAVAVEKDVPLQSALSSTADDFERLSEGQGLKLSEFEMGITLGQGAYGHVVLVTHKATGRHFAMKVLSKAHVIRQDQVLNVQREIEIMRKMRHPFIVSYGTHFQDERHLYITAQFVRGGELYSVMQRTRAISNHFAVLYAAELLLALEHMHQNDVVYRDLKPENILLDTEGHLKITDFGLSKVCLKRTYTMCGTLDYIAPEILTHKGHDCGADYWALGVVIFEMLSGLPPFYCRDNDLGTVNKILHREIDWPRKLDGNARDLIEKLLCVDVSHRFGCMAAGAEDIKRHYWFDQFVPVELKRERKRLASVELAVQAGDPAAILESSPEEKAAAATSNAGAAAEGIDWAKVASKGYKMAFVPETHGEADTQHFDSFDKWDIKRADTIEAIQQPFFEAF